MGDKLEDTMQTHNLEVKELRERMQALEKRVNLLSKFTIKVTHAAATTLHLLKDNQEDSKIGRTSSSKGRLRRSPIKVCSSLFYVFVGLLV